tara:strand:+ start:1902 stop:2420 length:519 start_codon:yes stop_codon:yes gene_type:complete
MSVSITSITALGPTQHRVTVSTTLGPGTTLYWRINGAKYHKGTETTLVVDNARTVWVADDGYGDDGGHHPGFATLQVYIDNSAEDIAEVLFQRYENSIWATKRRVQVIQSGYYTWQSDWYDGGNSHQFRAVPVGTNGNNATATTFNVFGVAAPAKPTDTFTYDGGTRKVTVT